MQDKTAELFFMDAEQFKIFIWFEYSINSTEELHVTRGESSATFPKLS